MSFSYIGSGASYPYSAVVHLDMYFPSGRHYIGSGAMIDRFHVLTAGHCVYDAGEGGWATRIVATPGEAGGRSPFGTASATFMRTFSSYVQDSRANSHGHAPGDGDIALVTLNRTIGDRTGWFGFGYNDNDGFFRGLYVNKIGYPGSPYSGTDMYADFGRLTGPAPGKNGFSALSCSTTSMSSIGGESGSGVYYKDSASHRYIYGVQDVGNSSTGYAERINATVFNYLRSWLRSDTPPQAKFALSSVSAGPGHLAELTAWTAPTANTAWAPIHFVEAPTQPTYWLVVSSPAVDGGHSAGSPVQSRFVGAAAVFGGRGVPPTQATAATIDHGPAAEVTAAEWAPFVFQGSGPVRTAAGEDGSHAHPLSLFTEEADLDPIRLT
jgi:V8-like Glu-specific endopeptidase